VEPIRSQIGAEDARLIAAIDSDGEATSNEVMFTPRCSWPCAPCAPATWDASNAWAQLAISAISSPCACASWCRPCIEIGMASDEHENPHAYRKLLLMATGSFVAMYVLMYMMVDAFTDVYPNINQLYMAAMMTAPMVVIELLFMRAMFSNRRANVIIIAAAALTLIASITLLRRQAGVSDTEFLRSMIPHHSAAVLMCERAPLKDAEIKELCRGIISSQQGEIDWMKQKLARR
jgi:hypothetical protein